MDLDKTYNPETAEAPWYDYWEKLGYFMPNSQGEIAYAVVIPPPNVTGSLHMGHALNSTLQDTLIRWHRMKGDRTVWVPGTDHGGIATQNVVEKMLRAEKKTRHDLGRDKFLERMWQWRRESGDTILMQLRRLGASCDWTRTRFTMDEECSHAVRHAFVALFKKGLIYRGPRMVNWCPKDATALSDIEVEHEERSGKLWHIRYPLSTGGGSIVVATTRPETMLGDTAVAVNPEDPRFKAYIGKKLKLPLTDREIPVISDDAVESGFGTGAVKVTPAHDPTDFEIGERHKLPHVVVIGFDAKMTSQAGAYAGLDRYDARKQIVADLEAQGLLEKAEDYRLSVAECYRCQTVIEPLVSEQWFMSMKGMAARAAQATRDGKMKIFPSSWEKPYLSWLDNIRDWCISRQIWWGHRIPVYYCGSKCPPLAAEETPDKCPTCGSKELRQDDDVLDTWFSSALWPLSVFGWPQQTSDLKTFYPTSVLVTGHEILYLWVARMVMMGLEFQNDVPFKHVYIHGIVRDKQGKKMSKSLGNVIDPLEIMKQYGTDALRFSMAESSIPGRDLHLSNDSFLKARNFANKLWNASRFILMNLEGFTPRPLPSLSTLGLADHWILHELQEAIAKVTSAFGSYNPAEASRALYEFIWGSLCDWYLEISKVALTGQDAVARLAKQTVLVHLLDHALALLHPVMPYETEALYQVFKPYINNPAESLMIHSWPQADLKQKDPDAQNKMRLFKDVVSAIRTQRSEFNLLPGLKVPLTIKTDALTSKSLLENREVSPLICFLTGLESLTINAAISDMDQNWVPWFYQEGEIFIRMVGTIDRPKLKERLLKKLKQYTDHLTQGEKLAANASFRKAAQDVWEIHVQSMQESRQRLAYINRILILLK